MSIEHCPRCSARVRVPAAAEPESWVRCPRCRVETQLSELLAAEPPELELIDGPSGAVPEYTPALAGAATEGEEFNEFHVMAGDTLVTDEDSPTLPFGGVALSENLFDEETGEQGASIGRASATKSADDELFGFDDNPDTESLRSTSEDGKFIGVPDDGEEGFNLASDSEGDVGAAAISPAALGTGLKGIPTGVPRRRKKSGMLPMMIGVVGGGLFGILIAYYGILMWAMGQDPFKVAKYFPESMQMLLPESLQAKPIAKNTTPPANPDSDPSDNMPPEGATTTPGTETGSGEPGTVPAPSTDPLTTPGTDPLTTNPLDPLTTPEKPATPSTDPLDAFGNNAPVKPADPLTTPDPFGNNAPVKPEMPAKPEATTPADPLLDPLNPGAPVSPPKPEVTTPAPVDPLNALDPVKPEFPPKPEMPTKPEVALPTTPDPIDSLIPKPVDPVMPPAVAKAAEPLMLASASFAPADLEASLTQAMTSHEALTQKPDDKPAQIASYRALSRLGEVAGQLKSLGDTPEKTAEHLKALQATSKKLADDPSVAGIGWLTAKWLTADPKNRNNGIVLQGTPGTSEPAGKFHRTSFDLPGSDQKLTVVSEYPLLPNADGKVTVLGVIVEKPTEQIPGYPGPAERVVWVSVGEMEKPAAAPANDAGAATPPAPAPAKAPSDDPFGDLK